MMQLLEAGGADILSDGQRQPDASNPRGYYEYELVKSLARDSAWMGRACGKAVKIVSPLLAYLPPDHTYRVIFMQRDVNEIVRSQVRMRSRLAADAPQPDCEALAAEYTAHLSQVRLWLSRQSHIETLYVAYSELIHSPAPVIDRVNRLVGGGLDVRAMPQVIDPALYRERE